MVFQTKDKQKSFGSAYVAKKYDSVHSPEDSPKKFPDYEDGKQPGEENENEHSTSEDHGDDKVNTETPDAGVVAREHGVASSVTIHHGDGKHTVSATMGDGHQHTAVHPDAGTAHDHATQLSLEAGGEDQNTDVKRRTHPDQQGAESEERNYEAPDLA